MYRIILNDNSVVTAQKVDFDFKPNFISTTKPEYGSEKITIAQNEVIIPISSIKVILR